MYGQCCIYVGQSDIDLEQQKLLYHWWEHELLLQPLWREFWKYLGKLYNEKGLQFSNYTPKYVLQRNSHTYEYIKRHVKYILILSFTVKK